MYYLYITFRKKSTKTKGWRRELNYFRSGKVTRHDIARQKKKA